jgi:energy-coupling factor transporter transmembrane protein EcfT
MWGFFIALACAVITTGSVFVALGAVGVAALLVYLRREEGPWGSSFKWSLIAGLYLLVIRLITGILIGVPRPGTTIFTVPRVELPSWLPGIRIGGAVTWERLSSSLSEGLIIASVIALFGAANSVTSPRKLLRTLPTSLYQVGVALTIATTVLPQLVSSITRIRSAQFLRNGKKVRVSSIALPLLEESLSRAIHLAQSMESRGYGTSKVRSRYRPIPFKKIDSLYLSAGTTLALLAVFA